MFTGIIRAQGKVKMIAPQTDGGLFLDVTMPRTWRVKAGESISVNGICSTVRKKIRGVSFEYMPETLSKTNVFEMFPGKHVNLERSLRAQDRLDGHVVQGHVDTTGEILSLTTEGNARVFTVRVEGGQFMRYLAPKGSVALEGISLTVVDVGADFFTVKVIPYTLEETNLGEKKKGDKLNIEFDIMAKYIERLIQK